MTAKDHKNAAEIVRNIREGNWSDSRPEWSGTEYYYYPADCFTQAVQTAEAFVMLFKAENSRFNQQRFLKACGF